MKNDRDNKEQISKINLLNCQKPARYIPVESNPIKKDFEKAMEAAYDIFGQYAFRKIFQKKERKHPINKALFDCLSVILAKLSKEEISILIQKKDFVKEKFIALNGVEDFSKSITTGTGKIQAVKTRFLKIDVLLKEISNDR